MWTSFKKWRRKSKVYTKTLALEDLMALYLSNLELWKRRQVYTRYGVAHAGSIK